jgi:hypothetical protein
MHWAARRLASAALGVAVCWPGASLAQPKVAPEEIEAILGQSLLEQAAFRTCAIAGNDTETAGIVTKGWQLDLGEVADILLKAGYPDDYVRSLKARFDIDKAAPKFADPAALAAYCAALRDWQRRRAMLLYSVPQIRINQALKR